MRVAFVSSRLDYNDGVASHIELLASNLLRHGVELTMLTGLTTGKEVAAGRYAALRELFAGWHEIGSEQLRPRLATIRAAAAILRPGSVGRRFDLVHAHGIRILSVARMATLGLGMPLVTTYHPSAHGNQASDFALRLGPRERLSYRAFLEAFRPESLIALSTDTDLLFTAQVGLSPRRVRKIICGVDLSHFRVPTAKERAAARAALHLDDDTLTFVLPGRLNLNKGHDLVVAAFHQLRQAYPGLKLKCLFPGAGAQAAEIRAMVAASSDPSMFALLGFVPDMRAVYWAADAALLPSRNEGFAIVIAEAMACGCAAIRTPSGGCSDQIIEGQTGYTVRFNEPGDIARRVEALSTPRLLEMLRG